MLDLITNVDGQAEVRPGLILDMNSPNGSHIVTNNTINNTGFFMATDGPLFLFFVSLYPIVFFATCPVAPHLVDFLQQNYMYFEFRF